jgi:hypothetical protein
LGFSAEPSLLIRILAMMAVLVLAAVPAKLVAICLP